MVLAGIVEQYDTQSSSSIPDQWKRFSRYIGRIGGAVDEVTYGVIYNVNPGGTFDYMCGVEVTQGAVLPAGLSSLELAARRYAVFVHRGHLAGLRSTFQAIWGRWLPGSGWKHLEGPTFERYGPGFNPVTGMGGLEIWVPIQR
jgi:AraC family transcriptional regulator